MMPNSLRAGFALALMALVGGCAGSGPPGGDDRRLPELGVDFSWKDVPACTNTSPRIVVRNAPAGTARFRVELVDKDSAFARHGGGEVTADPSGVIAPGALTAYRGPCPAQVAIHYEMRVWALDASGKVVARGVREDTFTPARLSRSIRR